MAIVSYNICGSTSTLLLLKRGSRACIRYWSSPLCLWGYFFFQAEDGIRDADVTGVQTCALPICRRAAAISVVVILVSNGLAAGALAARARPLRMCGSSGLLLREVVGSETWLVGLVVEELAHAFLAAFVVEAVGGFLGTHQVVLGVVVAHVAHAADGVLGGLQGAGVLLQQGLGHFGDAGLQAIGRQRLVDQAPLGGRAAVDVLAQHGVVHGTAEGQ